MANTVNWNIPNIKAGKVSAANNAYTNPRFPIADQFSIWGKVAENVGKSVAMGLQQQQQNVVREKTEQAALLKRTNSERAVQYDEVAQVSSIGGSNFEISKDQMLYGLKDKYVEIKMAMDDPNSGLDPIVAARALAEINDSVAKYKTQAPLVLAAATILKKAMDKGFGESGAIASKTPTPQQEILLSLITDGNLGIKDYQGEFYLYKQEEEFNPQGLSVFNIDSYMKQTSNGQDPEAYFEQIIDTKEMDKGAVNALIPSGKGLPIAYFTPQEETTTDGKKVVNFYNYKTDKDGHEIGKEALIKNMALTGFNFMDESDYENDARNLYNDTAGFTGKQSGQDDVWAPNQKDENGNEIRKAYKVKGSYKKDQNGNNTGEFVFDPKGNESQFMMDYATGTKKMMTQKEFLKRWLSERALLNDGPKNLKTMTSVSKAPGGNKGGFNYLIDSNFTGDPSVATIPPYIAGRGSESWFLVKESEDRAKWTYQKKNESKGKLDAKTAIFVFNTNKKGDISYNRTGHRQISNKTKDKN
tara:strand:+ start:11897 stop:13480 length:1584 start_codon:yes stop_codon:yes gene_type:complete